MHSGQLTEGQSIDLPHSFHASHERPQLPGTLRQHQDASILPPQQIQQNMNEQRLTRAGIALHMQVII